MLSQSIAEDIEFNEIGLEAQLMYLRTIPFLDRDGLVNGHPAILFGKIAPLLPDILPKMKTIIDEWVTAGLVIPYTDGKTSVLYFKGFTQNQIGLRYEREPESQFSAPPGFSRTKNGIEKDAAQTAGRLPEDCRKIAGSDTDDSQDFAARVRAGARPEENKREENVAPARTRVSTTPVQNAPSAPQPTAMPERKNGKVTHYDPRQVDKGGLLPKGTGTTQIEIWKESFAWTPTSAQIRDMNERVTDLDKWRQVTAECAIKAFRSYSNVIDVYLHGWREPTDTPAKRTVSGDIGINLTSI